MIKWETFVHKMDNGKFAVMIRNHNTAYALSVFVQESHAQTRATSIQRMPFAQKVQLYREAMKLDILCLHHNRVYRGGYIELFAFVKAGKSYELNMLINSKWYTIRKARYKKDLVEWLKEKRSEYSDQEMHARMLSAVQAGRYSQQA